MVSCNTLLDWDLFDTELRPLAMTALCRALQTTGVIVDDQLMTQAWLDRHTVSRAHQRWLQHSTQWLVREGYLAADTRGTLRTTELARRALREHADGQWQPFVDRWSRHAALRAQLTLFESAVKYLPAILRGEMRTTQIFFPKGSTQNLELLYAEHESARYFNSLLAEELVRHIALGAHAAGEIRLLEVGAGTGSTTEAVLHTLEQRGYTAEYWFTDISRGFLARARNRYETRQLRMSYHVFDVERAPQPQGIPEKYFAAVIAANVLHTTRSVRQALRQVKRTLQDGGLLLLNEITGTSIAAHMTFGLLEGWWLYDDEELRIPGSPALSRASWQRALDQAGFENVTFPPADERFVGQQTIVSLRSLDP
jgi:SAM-dependent methyltransferase